MCQHCSTAVREGKTRQTRERSITQMCQSPKRPRVQRLLPADFKHPVEVKAERLT